MNNRPVIDRELLIPILIGGFSVIGIVAVLLIGRALHSPAEVTATPSATPFRYVYLGTEPAVTTLVVDGSELPPTEEPVTEPPIFDTPTLSFFPTPIILRSNTPSDGGLPFPTIATSAGATRTSTPSRVPTITRTSTPSAANTYDDTDSRLKYSGDWISETGLSESGPNPVYQGTLHISNVADDKSVTIQFSGQEIFFYYQSGPTSGTVTIYLDNDTLAFTTINQAQGGGVWHYVFDSAKTHIVKIAHTDGGSVNIDKFIIPAATPTPTRTPTP